MGTVFALPAFGSPMATVAVSVVMTASMAARSMIYSTVMPIMAMSMIPCTTCTIMLIVLLFCPVMAVIAICIKVKLKPLSHLIEPCLGPDFLRLCLCCVPVQDDAAALY